MPEINLRQYQADAIDGVFNYWAGGGGSPLLDLATGLGKSIIVAKINRDIITRFPKMRILNLVHVQELVEQNFTALIRLWPDAPAGIYSAGLGRRDTHHRITFGSIQSVFKRGREIGPRNLLIVDEAHLLPEAGEGMYRTLIEALRQQTPDMRVMGLTATPYRLDSGRLDKGDRRLFDEIVYSYGVGDGIDDGWLAPLTARAAEIEIDVSGVAKRGGEFVAGALEAAADTDELVKAAALEIAERGRDRRSWLCFCSGVKHAFHVAEAIRELGYEAATVTGETPKDERRRLIADFKSGKLRALTNAQVLCLDAETEILTSDGWVGIDDMSLDHKVASWDFDGSIIFDNPKLVVRRPIGDDERFVSVAGMRNNIRVTGNHRMVARKRHGKWEIRDAESIADERVRIPVSGVAMPFDVEPDDDAPSQKKIAARIRSLAYVNRQRGQAADEALVEARTDVLARVEMKSKSPRDLSVDDCMFIGFWLGDGTLSPRCEFSQSNAYPKIVRWFDDLLVRLRLGHSRMEREPTPQLPLGYVRWSVARGTGGKSQAREVGYFPYEPYLKKEGSPLYWGLDGEQFAALMHGFWMADGNHGDGECASSRGLSIAGAQGALYDLLQAIGVCRGYRVSKTLIPPRNPNHSQQWRLGWRKCSETELVNDRLQIEPPRPEGHEERVWCVTSVTGNIVTRRAGKVAVVGNTTGFDAPATDLIAFLRPTLSTGLYVQMMGRGTRPVYPPGFDPNAATSEERVSAIAASSKRNCLVLDFSGNVRRHGPVDAVYVKDKKKRPGATEEDEFKVKEESVRAKTCPSCGSLQAIAALACKDCGYEWPAREPKHDKRADLEAVVLSRELPKQEATEASVYSWSFHEHRKWGASDQVSLKCTFYAGLQRIDEYLAFGRAGFAGQKAGAWWREHGGELPIPMSVADALGRTDELKQPKTIFVKMENGWPRIVARRFEREDA